VRYQITLMIQKIPASGQAASVLTSKKTEGAKCSLCPCKLKTYFLLL
jgi:hypothetical protein